MEQFKTILLALDNIANYVMWTILSIFILRAWFKLSIFPRWKTHSIDFTLVMIFAIQFIIRVAASIVGVEVTGFTIVMSAVNILLWITVYKYEKFTYLKE